MRGAVVVALAASVALLALGGPRADSPMVPPAAAEDLHVVVAAAAPAPRAGISWKDKLQRRNTPNGPVDDPFSSKNWTPPPPPPPPPQRMEASAPAFPFKYMGKLLQQDAPPKLFLTQGDQLYTASPGDVLNGVYRLETVGDAELEVTYLPLGQRQRIAFYDITPAPTDAAGQPTGVDVAVPFATLPGVPVAGAALPGAPAAEVPQPIPEVVVPDRAEAAPPVGATSVGPAPLFPIEAPPPRAP